ncbi:TetR/AcrR family transcriptional regulator [Flavimaribacter sediminis]|uniref:TetR/AcrR family transcriptional regulator n=1 Tax=Flavimaribacter sediminis TaxID=2865987 RepID=UPI00351E1A9E
MKAASALFYSHGVRASNLDRIAEKAGVTKRTVYYHFTSKDELIEAYLTARDGPNLAAMKSWFHERGNDPASGVRAVFSGMKDASQHRLWRGCGYLRTAGELANMPGHPAIKAASLHKKNVEAWLAEEFCAAGIDNADTLARQVTLLMDGAFSVMLVHHDPDYIEQAGEAAAALIEKSMHTVSAGG